MKIEILINNLNSLGRRFENDEKHSVGIFRIWSDFGS
jgi:hypothetical protein